MPRALTVHLIPHSHTDPGWLKTYDAYYNADVRKIISNVVDALTASENRSFVWSETCYFARWWSEQSERGRRADVRRLVASGRLEFVGGGWVQHDEALPTVAAVLDAMAEGHSWLNDTLAVRPTVGWQIDTFGHSASSTALLGQMGLSSVVLNRVHHKLKERWRSSRQLEFAWRGVPQLGRGSVLAHVLHTHYASPKGFDFEDAVPSKFETLSEQGRRQQAQRLRSLLLRRASSYRTQQLMVLAGDDFKWVRAGSQFTNWERLAHDVGRLGGSPRVRMHFSTPSRYFAAVRDEGPPFPSFGGDLLPYADNDDSYWVGFYSSRPVIKRLVRRASAAVHAAELLYALCLARAGGASWRASGWRGDGDEWFGPLVRSRRDVALLAHHDAITGTSPSRTIEDYEKRLHKATRGALGIAAAAAAMLTLRSAAPPTPDASATGWGPLVPVTSDGRIDRPSVLVVVNAAPFRRCESVHLRLASPGVAVTDAAGAPLPLALLPPTEGAGEGGSDRQGGARQASQKSRGAGVRVRRASRDGSALPSEAVGAQGAAQGASVDPPERARRGERDATVGSFLACVPPLGAETFFLTRAGPLEADAPRAEGGGEIGGADPRGAIGRPGRVGGGSQKSSVLRGGCVDARLDPRSGMLQELLRGGGDGCAESGLPRSLSARVSVLGYPTSRSGHYIMRLETERPAPLGPDPLPQPVRRAPHFEQLTTAAGGSFTMTTRLHRAGALARSVPVLELLLAVTSPPNREVVVRLETGLAGGDAMYTHDGLTMRRRTTPAGENGPSRNLAARFFPTAVGAALRRLGGGDGERVVLLTDRAVGVARVEPGTLDVLVHRSLLQSDHRGVNGANTDGTVARVRLLLLWAPPEAEVQRLVFAVQAPLLPLNAACAAGEARRDNCSRQDWLGGRSASFSAVSREAAAPLMLWPRSLHNGSSRILLRVQQPCCNSGFCGGRQPSESPRCDGNGALEALRRLFAGRYRLSDAREVGLTGGPLGALPKLATTDSPAGVDGAASDQARRGGGGVGDASAADAGGDGGGEAGAQNSDEAGVFVSDAALAGGGGGGDGDGGGGGGGDGVVATRPRRRLLSGAMVDGDGGAEVWGDALGVRAFSCVLVPDVELDREPDDADPSTDGRSDLLRAKHAAPSGVSASRTFEPQRGKRKVVGVSGAQRQQTALFVVQGSALFGLLALISGVWRRRCFFFCGGSIVTSIQTARAQARPTPHGD